MPRRAPRRLPAPRFRHAAPPAFRGRKRTCGFPSAPLPEPTQQEYGPIFFNRDRHRAEERAPQRARRPVTQARAPGVGQAAPEVGRDSALGGRLPACPAGAP